MTTYSRQRRLEDFSRSLAGLTMRQADNEMIDAIIAREQEREAFIGPIRKVLLTLRTPRRDTTGDVVHVDSDD